MGGTNENKIDGLRFHVNNGDVHVHDDAHGIKFTMESADFRTQVKDTLRRFEDIKDDGVVRIRGKSSSDLCLVKEGKSTYAFLSGRQDQRKDLESFLKGC